MYKELFLKMGEQNFDGGQVLTPHEVIRAMARTNPVLYGIDQPNLWHGNTLTGADA